MSINTQNNQISAQNQVFYCTDLVRLLGTYVQNDEFSKYVCINRASHNAYEKSMQGLKKSHMKYLGLIPIELIKALGGYLAFAKLPEFNLELCERYKLYRDYIDFVSFGDLSNQNHTHPISKGMYGDRPFLTFIYASLPSRMVGDSERKYRSWCGEVFHPRYGDSLNFQEWTTAPIPIDRTEHALLVNAPRATQKADVLDRISRLVKRQPVGQPVEIQAQRGYEWIENPERTAADGLSCVYLAEDD